MKSRLFLSSLLLLARCFMANGCGPYYPIEPKHHWIFYTGYPTEGNWQSELDERFREENITFWLNYVGQSVSREAVENALYRVYLLNEQTDNAFFKQLIQRRDTVALDYWMSLKTSDSVSVRDEQWKQSVWYYSTDKRPFWQREDKPDRQQSDVSILKVNELDENCIKRCPNKAIRNRYVLQVMRKCFYDENYQKCIAIWKRYGRNIPQSALRIQCLNYYGGALLRLGRKEDAATVYAGIGYFNIYLHYDPATLRSVYQQNPNNKRFDFMVQQFVNYYFDHPNRAKAEAFNLLVDDVIREGKSKNPALWKSAQSALAYINRDMDAALQLLHESEKMSGTPIVKENIRMMRLIFNSSRTDNDSLYEETLYPDLKWLVNRINADLRRVDTTYWGEYNTYGYGLYEGTLYSNPELHRVKVLRRVIFLGAVPHFERIGQPYKSIAYLNLYDETYHHDKEVRNYSRKGLIITDSNDYRWRRYKHPPVYQGTYRTSFDSWHFGPHEYGEGSTFARKEYDFSTWCLNFDYGTNLFEYIDTANISSLLQYVSFIRSGGSTPAEKFLLRNNYTDLNYFYELIGTRYLRKEQYVTAIVYLQKVSDKFRKTQNISEYLSASRNPFAERWITKKEEKGKYVLSFNPAEEYAKHPGKLTFCRLMLRLQRESQSAKTAEERANAAYAYAVGLYQSALENAWALKNYSSTWYNSAKFLEDLSEYADGGFKLQQKKVDAWLNKAMRYDKDRTFVLKCKILHSKYRGEMKETVQQKEHTGVSVYYYNSTYTIFNKEVRAAFCDRWQDYDARWDDWGRSAWYY